MRFTLRLGWTALLVNVGVIAMGALVRATHSGAGCGRSWPTCQGTVVPAELSGEALIEFSHRAASGLALLSVALLFIVAARAEQRSPLDVISALFGSPLAKATGWAVVTVVVEALIGAAIVLSEWVVHDSSLARVVAVPLHLVNTFLLLAALASVVAIARDGVPPRTLSTAERRPIGAALGALVFTAAFGAVAALADTLFPSDSIVGGVAADFSGEAHLLTRLRIIHPIVAVLTGLLLVRVVSSRRVPDAPRRGRWARAVIVLVVAQIVAGGSNIALLTPIWMQLIHLLLADALWISFVWFIFDVRRDQSWAMNSSSEDTGAAHTIPSQT